MTKSFTGKNTPIAKSEPVENKHETPAVAGLRKIGEAIPGPLQFHWSNPSLSLAKLTDGQGPKQSLQ